MERNKELGRKEQNGNKKNKTINKTKKMVL